MGDDKHNDDRNLFDKLIAVLLLQSWLEILGDVGKVVRRIVQARFYRGMYEVLEYEATLELEGPGGKRATFRKRERAGGIARGQWAGCSARGAAACPLPHHRNVSKGSAI